MADLHFKQSIMNINIQMFDKKTGDLIAKRSANYALNFVTRNDSGFECIMKWVQSCVRGVRLTEHKEIELRISFDEKYEQLPLFV